MKQKKAETHKACWLTMLKKVIKTIFNKHSLNLFFILKNAEGALIAAMVETSKYLISLRISAGVWQFLDLLAIFGLHEIEFVQLHWSAFKKNFLLTEQLKRILPNFEALRSKITFVFALHVNFFCKMHLNIL